MAISSNGYFGSSATTDVALAGGLADWMKGSEPHQFSMAKIGFMNVFLMKTSLMMSEKATLYRDIPLGTSHFTLEIAKLD